MMYNQDFAETDNTTLEDYLRGLRAHRFLVLALTVAGLAAGLFAHSQLTPTYKSTVSVILGPTLVGSANDTPRAPVLEREAEVLTSDSVARQVIDQLDLDVTEPELLSRASVTFLPRSEILDLEISAGTGQEAKDIANAFGQVYVSQAEAADSKLLEDRVAVLEAEQTAALAAVNDAQAEVDRLQDQRDDDIALPASAARDAAISNTDAALSTARTLYNLAVAQEREVRRQLDLAERAVATKVDSARLLRQATEPSIPSGLSRNVLGIAGLIMGLVAGVILAIVLDRLDSTARDEQSVNLALGAGVLAQVPRLPLSARSGSSSLIMLSGAKAGRVQQARESYRRLRSTAQFLASNQAEPGRALMLMITSAFPGEGKSVTSANLAIALAQSGSRVVLINADMRRPSLEPMFGVDSASGLSLFLGGTAEHSLEGLGAIELEQLPNFWLIPAGPTPANPAELLNSPRLKSVLADLESAVDYVIIDCPPVLSASDPLTVAQHVDGVIVVVDSRRTETDDLLQVRTDLENTGSKVVGAVLNRDGRRRGRWWRPDRYTYS